jgi:hypothetical protein
MKWLGKQLEEAILKEYSEKDVDEKEGKEDSEKSATPTLPSASFFQLFR